MVRSTLLVVLKKQCCRAVASLSPQSGHGATPPAPGAGHVPGGARGGCVAYSAAADAGGWQISLNSSLSWAAAPVGTRSELDALQTHRKLCNIGRAQTVTRRPSGCSKPHSLSTTPRGTARGDAKGVNSIGNYINSSQTNINVLFVSETG